MSEVEFSEEKAYNDSLQHAMEEKVPKKGLSYLPIKWGFAKDETGAAIVLSGITILAALAAVLIVLLAL